jgi:mannan endo-1,4-beta-mannosidase
MRNKILIFSLLFACMSCKAQNTPEGQSLPVVSYTLCNSNATVETQRLWSVLCSEYGKRAMSGVVANVDWNTRETENVYAWTGKYPALNVFDFINIHASKDVNKQGWLDYSDLTPVTDWYNAGGVVGCMWHWQVPANNGTNYTCSPGSEPGQTSFDPSKISDPSSDEYKRMVKDIDQVAGYLKKMQKRGIPVIWRPLHEASGNSTEFAGGGAWFWWGAKGAEAYKALWRFLYDRMVNYHKLNNLIWVWNSQVGDWDWYPGDDVVDVVGRDSYYALQYPLMKEFNDLKSHFPTKLICLAECGNGDEVDMSLWSKIWKEGSRWSWFMTWYDYNYNAGTSEEHQFAGEAWWRDAFNSGTVIDREEMKRLLDKIR